MIFSLCASLEQDLIKLSVELVSLQMHIEPEKKLPTIEISASSVVYMLGNGKRIKLLIGCITKLNVLDENTGEFSSFQ